MSWLNGRSMENIPTDLCEKSQSSSAKRQPADTRGKEATRTTGLLKQLQNQEEGWPMTSTYFPIL